MPRLLLVDDNPSIHKIAETLLARTGIELVCTDSAAQALNLIEGGERFDVALLDTAMAGMDGWELLATLRKRPETAGIPIAMMAGVLDAVDPMRIEQAPIQGFLKKPVELRDLAERVQKLLETPVPPPSFPEAVAEPEPMPELLPELDADVFAEPPAEAPASPDAFATLPSARVEDFSAMVARKAAEEMEPAEEDVLELTEADLLLEDEPAEDLLESPSEESLDLEELDLDGLRGLPAPEIEVTSMPTPALPLPEDGLADLMPPMYSQENEARETLDMPLLQHSPSAPTPGTDIALEPVLEPMEAEDLPDLGSVEAEESEILSMEVPPLDASASSPQNLSEVEPPLIDWMDESETLLPKATQDSVEMALPPIAMPVQEEPLEMIEETLSGVPTGHDTPTQTLLEVEESPISESLELDFLPEPPEAESVLQVSEALPEVHNAETQPEVPMAMEEISLPEQPQPVVLAALPESALAVAPESAPAQVAPQEPSAAVAAPTSEEYRAVVSLPRQELLEAILSDPALMDALCKAVVTRLGDHVLREVAWEVMPELAERIQNR